MNEQRSELVDEVQQLVEGAFNTGRGFSMMEPPFEIEESMARERANELIALVAAARDAEIREALMAPGPHSAIRRAAAFHIGLMAYGTEQEAE